MSKELPIPSDAAGANEANEVLRGWIIDERLECALDPLAFEQAGVWGIMLADVAHHVADGWAEATGEDPGEILTQIIEAFAAEMEESTGDPHGDLLDGES